MCSSCSSTLRLCSHTGILLELEIGIHYEILPLVDFRLDVLYRRTTAQKRLHDYVSRAAADAVIFSQHELTYR